MNPRGGFRPPNDLANRPLQPLGYLSVRYIITDVIICCGEMSEWLKEIVLKTIVSAMASWVRIPLSPPDRKWNFFRRLKTMKEVQRLRQEPCFCLKGWL